MAVGSSFVAQVQGHTSNPAIPGANVRRVVVETKCLDESSVNSGFSSPVLHLNTLRLKCIPPFSRDATLWHSRPALRFSQHIPKP